MHCSPPGDGTDTEEALTDFLQGNWASVCAPLPSAGRWARAPQDPPHEGTLPLPSNDWVNQFLGRLPLPGLSLLPPPPPTRAASIESMKPGKASWVQAGAPGMMVTTHIRVHVRAHPCPESRTAAALTVWGRQPRTAQRGKKAPGSRIHKQPVISVSQFHLPPLGKDRGGGGGVGRNAGTAKPCG